MLRRLAVSAFGASALALAVSTPASALPTGPWTLTGAGAGSTFTASSSSFVLLADGSPLISCSGAATGTVANTSGVWETPPPNTGDAVISPFAVTTSGCTPSPSTLTQNGTAAFYVTGPTSGGVTPGQIRGLSFKGVTFNGLCTFQVDGPSGANSKSGILGVTYDNSTGTITATGASNMKIVNASLICPLGGIKVGDPASLSGTFTVTGTPPTITAT